MRTITRLIRRWLRPRLEIDPRVAVLATELQYASQSLDRAAEAMKRSLVTPLLTKNTRAAATRARQTLGQLGLTDDAH